MAVRNEQWNGMKCDQCGRCRACIDGLCDDCYLKKYGDLKIIKRGIDER